MSDGLSPPLLGAGFSFLAGTMSLATHIAGCSWGVGCNYGSANVALLQGALLFLPLASLASMLAIVAILVDRRIGRAKWYPQASAYATLLASLAFVASAVQWHLAHKRFGKALSTRTNTGMIILGLGAWFSILAMVVGHPLRARPLHPLSWVGKRSGATTPTAATLPQSKEV